MNDRYGRRGDMAGAGTDARSNLETRWAELADMPQPTAPPGPVGALANRMLVYLRPAPRGMELAELDAGVGATRPAIQPSGEPLRKHGGG